LKAILAYNREGAYLDADGLSNGTIVDPGGITTAESTSSSGGSSSSDNCFINSLF